MENLLKETVKILKYYGKTPNDVLWCGSEQFGWFSWRDFKEVANVDYDAGYGSQKVAADLVIVGEDFWLRRTEYDGAESWEFLTLPKRPENYRKPVALTVDQSNKEFGNSFVGWEQLEELNRKQ